jgi:hypothetical protein
VHSHCLYCGKRLGFFHDRKKPYCSELHEDRHLENQAKSGLDRLLVDDFPQAAPPPLQERLPRKAQPKVDDSAGTPLAVTPDSLEGDEQTPPAASWVPDQIGPASNILEVRQPSGAAFEQELFSTQIESPTADTPFPPVHAPAAQAARPQPKQDEQVEIAPANLPLESFSREFSTAEFALVLFDPQVSTFRRRLTPRTSLFPTPPPPVPQPRRESSLEPIPLRTSRQLRYGEFPAPKPRRMRHASVPLDWTSVAPEVSSWAPQPIRARPTVLTPEITLANRTRNI